MLVSLLLAGFELVQAPRDQLIPVISLATDLDQVAAKRIPQLGQVLPQTVLASLTTAISIVATLKSFGAFD